MDGHDDRSLGRNGHPRRRADPAQTTSAPGRSRSPSRMRQSTCRAWCWRGPGTRQRSICRSTSPPLHAIVRRARAVLLGAADAERQPHDGNVRTGDRVPSPARRLPRVDQAMSRRRHPADARAGWRLARLLPRVDLGLRGGASRPTAPTPPAIDFSRTDTPLVLSAERYLLQLIGNDLSDDPALPRVQSDRGAARRQVRDDLPVVRLGGRRARRPLSPSLCGHPGDSFAARQLVDPGRRGGRNGDRNSPGRVRPDHGPAGYDVQRGRRLGRPFGTGRPANSRRRARPDSHRMDARTDCVPGRGGRGLSVHQRAVPTWNRRGRAGPTTTRRCRRSCRRVELPGDWSWGRAQWSPCPNPAWSLDRAEWLRVLDFIGVFSRRWCGTAVALRDAVTNRLSRLETRTTDSIHEGERHTPWRKR